MAGYHVVVAAPSIGRHERINHRPTSLLNARRVLWSFAARLERTPEVYDLTPDFWISDSGELCEGLRWRHLECDGIHECLFRVYVCESAGHDAELEDAQPWIHD